MPSRYPTLNDAKLDGKRVLLRAGFDVPMENGVVEDVSRVNALAPTMKRILDAGASLVILSHQGRPKGKITAEDSMQPLVPVLSTLLGRQIGFAPSCTGDDTVRMAQALKPGGVLLVENLRFDAREEKNDEEFAKELARLGDLYVNDAFPCCHRAHASVEALARLLPAYMGPQLQSEVEHLSRVIDDPKRPLTLIVSGAKMETKVPVIENFLEKGDNILLGGAIANTFIAARGFDVAQSLFEPDQVEKAQEIMLASDRPDRAKIQIPRDAVVATAPDEKAEKLNLPLESIVGDMAIYDIGKVTIERYIAMILASGMIVWNGPLGLYEFNRFSHATKRIAEAVAEATKKGAISIIGGGDTIDFHTRYGYDLAAYTFVSTGGGAMLEFVSGKSLPGLEVLAQRS